MKLDVPYYSQHEDIKDERWQKRACGVVCLKMVLDFHLKTLGRPTSKGLSLDEFLEKALEKQAYHQTNGWIHDKLLEIARDFGMEAFRKENMEDEEELKDFLEKGNPVIVSVKAKKFSPEFEGKFHQIVLVGYDEKGFFYNDSDYQNDGGKDIFVDLKTFQKYWRKMALFIHKID